jgi:fused signal recognition particle receptor
VSVNSLFERLKQGIDAFVSKVRMTELDSASLDPLLNDLRISMLENDVALEVADRICEDVKKGLEGVKVRRFNDHSALVREALRKSILSILTPPGGRIDLLEYARRKRATKRPLVLLFAGINGTGKTTTIAKVANLLQRNGFSVVLACSDTYRTGSIEQLEEHAKRLGVRMVKHAYGSDAASVAYDAIKHAESKGIDVVLIDTAGRMQTDRNLMDEMKKIAKVASPDLALFVGDALAGNDATQQAQEFAKFIDLSGTILTKMDADAKGGAAISIAYVTGKPILYVGVGQRYEDLEPFDPSEVVERIFGRS